MSEALQQAQAATIIDVRSLELPPAKFPPKRTLDGRSTSLHTVAKLTGIGVRIGRQKFDYRSPNGNVQAYMNTFAGGLMHVHVFDQLNPDLTIDGSTPLDVEIAAIIARGVDDRVVDCNIYFTVRPSTSTEAPTEILTIHSTKQLPTLEAGGNLYLGRLSAIAVRPVKKKAANAAPPDELPLST